MYMYVVSMTTHTTGSCEAGDNYANQLKDVLMHSCPKKVAGFFAEPIQVKSLLPFILLECAIIRVLVELCSILRTFFLKQLS